MLNICCCFLLSIRMPFDWKTPLGYPLAWIFQLAGGCSTFSMAILFVGFMVGSCWLFTFVADDITEDLKAFNSAEATNENRVEKLKRFYDIIEIYSDAKQ